MYIIFNFIYILILFVNKNIKCYDYFPENYYQNDMFFDGGDLQTNRLIAAKYFTNNTIEIYIKNQGFNLRKDYSLQETTQNYNAWGNMSDKSSYKNLYENSVQAQSFTYKFPTGKFISKNYIVNHKFWLICTRTSCSNIKILFLDSDNYQDVNNCEITSVGVKLISLSINRKEDDPANPDSDIIYNVTCPDSPPSTFIQVSKLDYIRISSVENIAMSFHWTTLQVISYDDPPKGIYSFKGGVCDDATNPCVEGYACIGSECVKCDISCYTCFQQNSNTNCGRDCSIIATTALSDTGTCKIGYVDLAKFADFTITDMGPPRTNRMTFSFWYFYIRNNTSIASIITEFFTMEITYNQLTCSCLIPEVGVNNNNLDENKWNYVKCGYSKDHGNSTQVFLQAYSGGTREINKYSTYGEGDVNHYKYFFRKSEVVKISFNGFSSYAYFYMKSFFVFKEYLPDPYDIKYFQLEKFVSPITFGEIILSIPFDFIEKDGDHFNIKYYSYDSTSNEGIANLFIAYNKSANLYPPRTFKRLNLFTEQNIKYTTPDLYGISKVQMTSLDLFNAFDNYPFSCMSKHFLDISTNVATTRCVENCPEKYSMIHGLNDNKGICNYNCDTFSSSLCLDENHELLTIKNNYKCKDETFYDNFYKCEGLNEENVLFYSHKFTPGNIVIDLSKYYLNSYFVEFWIRISNAYQTVGKHYLFYLNSIQIRREDADNYVCVVDSNVNRIDLITDEWNHVVLSIVYEPKENQLQRTKAYYLVNNNFDYGNFVENMEKPLPLLKIYFCDHEPSTCDGIDVVWGSAFYKNIRVWDGNKAQPSIIKRYDSLFPSSKINMVYSLLFYLSLKGKDIANNKLHAHYYFENIFDVKFSYNNWNFPQYNYGEDFDIPESCLSLTGCDRCHSSSNCYKCQDGYYLSGGNCKLKNGQKFFKLPMSGVYPKIILDELIYEPVVTMTFWIKCFGFFSSTFGTIINYSDVLRISFDPTENTETTGINLMYYTGSEAIALANYYYFRHHIGKWTFISVSHYNKYNDTYYPSMTRFEVNENYCPLKVERTYNLKFNNITFDTDILALYTKLKIYQTFLVGAYKYEIDNSLSSLVIKQYFLPVNFGSNCILDDGQSYDCDFDDFDNLNPITNCHSSCNGDCYISSRFDKCACNYNNDQTKLFLGNYSLFYCNNSNFINFAGANDITINNVKTAHLTLKYTMNFWVYANNYVDKQFGGINLTWTGHLNMTVNLADDGLYYFKCSSQMKVDLNLTFHVGQWNFLHCAIDYPNSYFYLNTYEGSKSTDFETLIPRNELTQLTATLTIKDLSKEKNWGVLFYQFIRLWSDAIPSASFLSKIEIKLITRFNGLLHDWNCLVGNFGDKRCNNLGDSSYDFTVTNHTFMPMNYIPEASYSTLGFCGDEGEYFDKKTHKCVQFTAVSNIQGGKMQINDVEVSYNHNYGIAFWILLENDEDINYSSGGIDIDWSYHMKIALVYDLDVLNGYCFPQNYPPYSDILGQPYNPSNEDTKYTNKLKNVLNGESIGLKNVNGKWLWIQCSLSYYNRKYYFNDKDTDLINEILYEDNTDVIRNDEPMGWFFSDLKKPKSVLTMKIPELTTSKIFLRALYCFRDFIPRNYNFKYMDLSLMPSETFPALSLAINFANYIINKSTKKFTVTYQTYSSTFKRGEGLMESYLVNVNNLQLSANFVFLPLCNGESTEKYDPNTNLCVRIDNCDLIGLNAVYCMEENSPLICKPNYFLNILSDQSTVCKTTCDTNLRTPGSALNIGVCNADCLDSDILRNCPHTLSDLQNYVSNFECVISYPRVDYQCFIRTGNANENKGALFYSNCNRPYNFNHFFSSELTNRISKNGYIIELWFMIDNIICEWNDGQTYHILYAYPHEVYRTGNNFYYKVLGTNVHQLRQINLYEWNKLIIYADVMNSEITIYQNFNFDLKDEDGNDAIINFGTNKLNTLYIYFCSCYGNNADGYRTPLCEKTNIQFGSVFYNNLRIWDLSLTNIETIQAYNSGIYTNIPDSLLVNYPLTLEYIDNNLLIDTIGIYGEDISGVIDPNTYEMGHRDKLIIYNYSTKFDWGITHLGNYIYGIDDKTLLVNECDPICRRCYAQSPEKCYECINGYVLYGQKCIFTKGKFFLKTPSTSKGEYSFITSTSTSDITKLSSFTISFWVKFYGVLKGVNTQNPYILSISTTTYLAFRREDRSLVLLENGRTVFEDKNFVNYIGKWIPIQIADYISTGYHEIYPHMFTLMVNRIDIPFASGYTIPETGITFSQINLGNEIIALFNDMRIYSKFYQGAYGKVMSTNTLTGQNTDLFIHFEMNANQIDKCISTDDLIASINIVCVSDYSPYFDDEIILNQNCMMNDMQYLEVYYNEITGEYLSGCEDCYETCTEFCYKSGNERCSCDTSKGVYWLRRNSAMETICEKIPYLDFSNIKAITLTNPPMTETYEYTTEFWFFVYSYNLVTNNFKKIMIEWNYHNKITISNENVLRVNCIPIHDSTNTVTDKYPDSRSQSISYYKWVHIRCGTDLLKGKYFLLSNEADLRAKKVNYPNYETISADIRLDPYKYFKIYRSDDSYTNFGYIFIRELKLWQQYNFEYLDSRYYDFKDLSIESIKKTFPGLLWYYRNLYEEIDSKLVLIEELSETRIQLGYQPDYIGYNIIDPNVEGKTSLLTLCPNDEVYSEDNFACIQDIADPTNECGQFADPNENCLICRENKKYLHAVDGSCVDECPATYFGNDKILQCRECHETCYRCTNRFYNNCTECTGSLYFNYKENTCIENCESVGLTKSNTRPNICVVFDAEASLVNVDTVTPIDVNTFTHIQATVVGATATGYTTYWRFNVSETNKINTDLGYEDVLDDDATPFTGDLTLLDTPLDHTFFKIGHKYVFHLDIIKENDGSNVTVTVTWVLTMNQSPQNGYIKVIPTIGLLETTTFVMTCYDFLDENTNTEDLEYFFYFIEDDTSSVINLSKDWSTNNEVYSNFSVRYYQPPTTKLEIYCKVRDQYHAENVVSTKITIVNHIDDDENYVLTDVLSNYDLNPDIEDLKYFTRSEFLKSVSVNPYREVRPNLYYSTFETSLDGSKILMNDPNCVDSYCNSHGECGIIDVTISCDCKSGYVGNNCNILKTGYSRLAYYYQEMYGRVFDLIQNRGLTIGDDILFNTLYNVFYSSQFFFQDDIFFTRYLVEYVNYLKNDAYDFILQSDPYLDKLFDLADFFFSYFYIKLNKQKLSNMFSSSDLPWRNTSLLLSQQTNYENAFYMFTDMLEGFTKFLIENNYPDYDFESTHFHYIFLKITESFSDSEWFEQNNYVKHYKSYVLFMDCLKTKRASFNYYLNIIEYKQYPYSWETTYYLNMTSSFLSIKIYDFRGNEVSVKDCEAEHPIKLYISFYAYNWIEYINKQKFLFDPENYKLPNDPVFKDPIFINSSGAVLNDTVDQRIQKYYRYYNITGIYYTPNDKALYDTKGITFETFTSDTDYMILNSDHLDTFSTMLIPNVMEFVVDGRFFYLKKIRLLKWKGNYFGNPGFVTIFIFFMLYFFGCFFYFLFDKNYFVQINELNFLKKEIIKIHYPYKQIDPGVNDKNIFDMIPNYNPEEYNKKEIKHMFDNVNFDSERNSENVSEIETENVFNLNRKKSSKGNPPKKSKKSNYSSSNGSEENEEEDNYNGSDFHSEESDNKTNKLMKRKKKRKKSIFSIQEKISMNTKKHNFFINTDKTRPNYVSLRKFHNSDLETQGENLPEDLLNEKEERFKALESYTNLKLATSEFIKWNIQTRHILFGPILNRSLFNQRWKKFTILITQLLVNLMLISVFLTNDEKITEKKFGKCLSIAIITAILSNLFIYAISFFFITSVYQRKRLFQLVMKGGQLVVIKAYNKVKKQNFTSNIIGLIICFIVWIICYYITFTFVAVWQFQRKGWIVILILSEFIDLVIGELGVEVFIGFLYHYRKDSNCMRDCGEWFNRLRCYRTLFP